MSFFNKLKSSLNLSSNGSSPKDGTIVASSPSISSSSSNSKLSQGEITSKIVPSSSRSSSMKNPINNSNKNKMFSIPVTSPKYKEFASKYLDVDGSINPDISRELSQLSCIKKIKIEYDVDNHRWGFDIFTKPKDTKDLCSNDIIQKLPCRILPC